MVKSHLPGIRVHVQDLDGNLSQGTLINDIEIDANSKEITYPKIELDNGKILYGYECWWIPVDEVQGENNENI